MARRKKIVWFARGGGIKKAGPFDSQVAAVRAMKLIDEGPNPVRCGNSFREPLRGGFPSDVFVWPEEVSGA